MSSAPDAETAAAADLRRQVESRLRRVCAGWPSDQFAALVADVLRFHVRWDPLDPPSHPA